MPSEFPSVTWNRQVIESATQLLRLALAEDLSDGTDWTTESTVGPDRRGAAQVVSRQEGTLCGLEIGPLVFDLFGADAQWEPLAQDGDRIEPGQAVATMKGRARDLLVCERTILNFMGRLSGIATLTHQFVTAASQGAQVYDTRKTTPGWRLLEKFAVQCGGGHNHRLGLSEAVLIKDNHLALSDRVGLTPADAIHRARQLLDARRPGKSSQMVIEVEVDTLEQFKSVLTADPDIVLLDNMTTDELSQAVALRDAEAPAVVLEASGGVNLGTIGLIAQTGVDRISVGALTHSAVELDLGLDWLPDA